MLALPAPAPGPSSRGQGTIAPPAAISRSDARLIGQAIRDRWPISPELRRRTIDSLAAIVAAPDRHNPRTVVSAARALLTADGVNLASDAAAAAARPTIAIDANGAARVDFSAMSDEALDRFLEASGNLR